MLQKEALDVMKMGYNVYLTGEAGTGKTYVLNQYIKYIRNKNINIAVCASTGIAATHLDGVTVDSWSGLGIRDYITDREIRALSAKHHLRKRIAETNILVIDEISMIDAMRFDAVDRILKYIRKNDSPFGGLQVILCGDLFQLPPVSPDRGHVNYIFKSRSWQGLNLKICYLTVPKRQSDKLLIRILTEIRHGNVSPSSREVLSENIRKPHNNIHMTPKLYTHNIDVDSINLLELDKIRGEPRYYFMTSTGPEKLTEMIKKTCLAPEKLTLKKGALVMFVRNNFEKGYVNGTLGKVDSFNRNDEPIIKTYSGKKITVEPADWTIGEKNRAIAQIRQIPLRLAWAITVHKSQGMTLDAAEIDLSKSFLEGMGYVALSRVKSLKGLKLLGINEMAYRVNQEVSKFDKKLMEFSNSTSLELRKMGWIRRWLKRRQFIYNHT